MDVKKIFFQTEKNIQQHTSHIISINASFNTTPTFKQDWYVIDS